MKYFVQLCLALFEVHHADMSHGSITAANVRIRDVDRHQRILKLSNFHNADEATEDAKMSDIRSMGLVLLQVAVGKEELK